MGQSLTGRLLVASPDLLDPNFHRTVVLVLDQNEDGALGLVLNRPSTASVAEAVPEWGPLAASPPVVFVGGPVAPGAVICLARAFAEGEQERDGWKPLFGRLGTIDLGRSPNELGVALEEIRPFSGYAGWAAGQLEGEVSEGAWFVLPASADDAFTPDPDDLWRVVLHRQGGKLALISTMPLDPSLN